MTQLIISEKGEHVILWAEQLYYSFLVDQCRDLFVKEVYGHLQSRRR